MSLEWAGAQCVRAHLEVAGKPSRSTLAVSLRNPERLSRTIFFVGQVAQLQE